MRSFCKPLIPLNGCKGTHFFPFHQTFSSFSISAAQKR